MKTVTSENLFVRAQKLIPGGVNSPVRAFRQVGGTPVFFKSAEGAYLTDEDDNKYIDFINSWGPMILGHSHPEVTKVITEKVSLGTSFGAPTKLEVDIAELIVSMVPNVDMVRMVSSGTEACMTAIRIARAYTGKNKIIKFEGCYHGHSDALLAKAGSGVATLGIQQVPGIPSEVLSDTITLTYNSKEEVESAFQQYPTEIACVIIEPVAGNMGCILPEEGYLEYLRDLCTKNNSVLIFDEVMTGFRLAPGGVQELYGIKADLVTFGKVIGGGMPVGCVSGRREVMEVLAPVGKVYQAGTLSGNPVAMIAGYTTLKLLKENPNLYGQIAESTKQIDEAIHALSVKYNIPLQVNRVGSMISIHFSDKPVTNFAEAAAADNERFKRFFHHCLSNGIYLPPSPFESWFISTAITDEEIAKVIKVTESFFKLLTTEKE